MLLPVGGGCRAALEIRKGAHVHGQALANVALRLARQRPPHAICRQTACNQLVSALLRSKETRGKGISRRDLPSHRGDSGPYVLEITRLNMGNGPEPKRVTRTDKKCRRGQKRMRG